MRRAAVVVGLLALMSACTPAAPPVSPGPPVQTGLPSRTPEPSASASRTPSQDELVKQAQAAYQVAFDEFERLSREGGADEPSAKMKDVETGLYLEQDMALLRDQKKRGYTVEGKAATAKSRPAPGKVKGDSDPRLTLEICEDRRGSRALYPDGRSGENRLWQGFVYAAFREGRMRLVDVDTSEVSMCSW